MALQNELFTVNSFPVASPRWIRSEEHTSELQSRQYLYSFPTRRSSDLKQRRQLDGATTDWIVVRNRLSMLGSRNKQLVADGLNQLSLRLGFRALDGFAERVVYREFFPRGLTALDKIGRAHV